MRHETFSTPGPVTLDLRLPAGEIEVEAVVGAVETTVELEPLRGEDAARAVETARVELRRADEVLVEVREERRVGIFHDTPEVRLTVRCPEGARLLARTASADLRARGRFAAAELATASGDVAVERVDGEARAKSASGDLSLGDIGGGRLQTASGDVHVDSVESSLEVQTASGDQQIDEVASGRIALKAASGDVHVGVRRGSAVWVDAGSLTGDTTSDLELGDEPADDEAPAVELKVSTMSGDVRIVHAAARAELQQ
jgi:DUF4097 and DUF4098 domain-containing protein YvlB